MVQEAHTHIHVYTYTRPATTNVGAAMIPRKKWRVYNMSALNYKVCLVTFSHIPTINLNLALGFQLCVY
jgi:hypothetical protein